MKYFIYALLILSIFMAGFNISQINFGAPFSKDGYVVFIATIAAVCVMILSLILLTSKKIEQKHNELKN